MMIARHALLLTVLAPLTAGMGSASARLALDNQTATARPHTASLLADGTSLRLKLIAAYLSEDVDPTTQNNIGQTAMIWLNPECNDHISGCNVEGMTLPPGPRITQYFDLARPSAEVTADLNAQDTPIEPATYRYARVEMCKSYGGQTQPTVPTPMWTGPGPTRAASRAASATTSPRLSWPARRAPVAAGTRSPGRINPTAPRTTTAPASTSPPTSACAWITRSCRRAPRDSDPGLGTGVQWRHEVAVLDRAGLDRPRLHHRGRAAEARRDPRRSRRDAGVRGDRDHARRPARRVGREGDRQGSRHRARGGVRGRARWQ